SDTVRGILDGHIVLSRELANKNHYPAIDVLASVSRVMPDIVDEKQVEISNYIKNLIATYNDSKDLINIGAYKPGTNPEIDEAIEKIEKINVFLQQKVGEHNTFDETVNWMDSII